MAMLQCAKTGRNPTMRHLARTHRISVGWVHEQYQSGNFVFAHEAGDRMPPDIFTKFFSNGAKWKRARQLINIVFPSELKEIIEENRKIYADILEKPALVGNTDGWRWGSGTNPSKTLCGVQKRPAQCYGGPLHGGRCFPNGGNFIIFQFWKRW